MEILEPPLGERNIYIVRRPCSSSLLLNLYHISFSTNNNNNNNNKIILIMIMIIQSMPVIRTLSGIKEYVLITGIFSMHMHRNESVSPKYVLISGVLITGIDCNNKKIIIIKIKNENNIGNNHRTCPLYNRGMINHFKTGPTTSNGYRKIHELMPLLKD